MDNGKKGGGGFTRLSDVVLPITTRIIKQGRPTPVKTRLIDAAVNLSSGDDPRSILFQHTVLCQTFLPYRDPGDDARTWERQNGHVHLKVLAGEAMHPVQQRLVEVGLPFGPKARLVLMHINQRALLAKSPEIEVQHSLTEFVRKALKLGDGGRTIRTVKDQLSRLSASTIRFGIAKDGHAVTINTPIVTAFDIWFPKDERQHVLWPSTVRLSADYWESLKTHAVPLKETAVAALSHNAMALDIYAWLAQRLHRIPKQGRRPLIAWPLLHEQFGVGYQELKHFRAPFKQALQQVKVVYPSARFDLDQRGLSLDNSPPPVLPRLITSS